MLHIVQQKKQKKHQPKTETNQETLTQKHRYEGVENFFHVKDENYTIKGIYVPPAQKPTSQPGYKFGEVTRTMVLFLVSKVTVFLHFRTRDARGESFKGKGERRKLTELLW